VEGVFRYAAQPRWVSHSDCCEHSFAGDYELPPRGVAMLRGEARESVGAPRYRRLIRGLATRFEECGRW
jgi:hypothetical protein